MAKPDVRFGLVEDAAALTQMLPAPSDIVWPTEAGDIEALEDAFRWLSFWLPLAKSSFRRHKAEMKAQAKQGRKLRAVA